MEYFRIFGNNTVMFGAFIRPCINPMSSQKELAFHQATHAVAEAAVAWQSAREKLSTPSDTTDPQAMKRIEDALAKAETRLVSAIARYSSTKQDSESGY
jgi:hypothetical protein